MKEICRILQVIYLDLNIILTLFAWLDSRNDDGFRGIKGGDDIVRDVNLSCDYKFILRSAKKLVNIFRK